MEDKETPTTSAEEDVEAHGAPLGEDEVEAHGAPLGE